jgi:hypothetical protein
MNPTTPSQPSELRPVTASRAASTTGKNWRLDWGPPGRRRPPHRSREGVSEAVATRQAKSYPRPLVPAHRGTKGRQADGTARARTQGNLRPGASPPSLRDERDARCKRIPRPNGRRTRHTPHGADVSRTHPVSPRRTRFGRRDVANGDVGPTPVPRWNPRVQRGEDVKDTDRVVIEDIRSAVRTRLVCVGCCDGRRPTRAREHVPESVSSSAGR